MCSSRVQLGAYRITVPTKSTHNVPTMRMGEGTHTGQGQGHYGHIPIGSEAPASTATVQYGVNTCHYRV